ncbi:RluA family pseudouridine synthase [Candidatus Uhrbacteria bacterium]|nr:RluA family pseudouridine synthase [Candidatus Uhrbacteria bacterium]
MITVPENAKDERLDRFLSERRPERSRSAWQKEIKAGRVLVNGHRLTPHYALKSGEEIEIQAPEEPRARIVEPPPLVIIAEEIDFLVVHKPAGLLVHPTDHSTEPTLVDALTKHDPTIRSIGEPGRPGIVHRIDRDASGVLVVAKTKKMYEHLKAQFAARAIHKEYMAIVHGNLPKDAGDITFTIARSRRGGRMAARPADADGRAARTHYEVVSRFAGATLVRVMPETGRTHQIRAHFHALGCPIIGDTLYRTKESRKAQAKGPPLRLMLHATKLTFGNLNGELHTYEAPLPEAFTTYLHTLEDSHTKKL